MIRTKILITVLLLMVITSANSFAQRCRLVAEDFVWYIASPSAFIVPRNGAFGEMRVDEDGTLKLGVRISPLNRLSFGLSYGIRRFIGNDEIELRTNPGFFVKFQLCIESRYFPCISIGGSNEGWGPFHQHLNP